MRQVFGGETLICNINRLCKWEMVTPERYVLLQCFAGLSCEIVFSRKRVADYMEVKLRSLRKSEVRRTKKQVAEELSVTQAQLDILVQRYNIHPFWRAEGGDTPEKKLRLIITNSITMDCRSGNPDPMTEAFLQIAGVFSQLELSMIRARVRSPLDVPWMSCRHPYCRRRIRYQIKNQKKKMAMVSIHKKVGIMVFIFVVALVVKCFV